MRQHVGLFCGNEGSFAEKRPVRSCVIHVYCHIVIATHCNTAKHCSTLQYTATHCNTLQHTAPHCNTLAAQSQTLMDQQPFLRNNTCMQSHCNLQHTATHCNTLQHTATPCITPQHTATHSQRNHGHRRISNHSCERGHVCSHRFG